MTTLIYDVFMSNTGPEFNKFVADQAAENGMSADRLGSRIIGRWKSGAPIDITPDQDDPVLAADPMRNNDFTFDHPPASVIILVYLQW